LIENGQAWSPEITARNHKGRERGNAETGQSDGWSGINPRAAVPTHIAGSLHPPAHVLRRRNSGHYHRQRDCRSGRMDIDAGSNQENLRCGERQGDLQERVIGGHNPVGGHWGRVVRGSGHRDVCRPDHS